MRVIKVTDYSDYNAEFCNNGGCYSYTKVFIPIVNAYKVLYFTSAEFSYCPIGGCFCSMCDGDDYYGCRIDIVSKAEVKEVVAKALDNENFDIEEVYMSKKEIAHKYGEWL